MAGILLGTISAPGLYRPITGGQSHHQRHHWHRYWQQRDGERHRHGDGRDFSYYGNIDERYDAAVHRKCAGCYESNLHVVG